MTFPRYRYRVRNLPRTDARYWATIISACCIGETLGDYISHGLNLGYGGGSIALLVLFVLVLIAELRATTHSATRYWLSIVVTSTTGTTLADFTSRSLKLGYGRASLLLVSVLALLLFLGYRTAGRKSLSADAIYWLTILVVSTFGTTMGDYVSDGLSLGPGIASLILGGALAIVLLVDLLAKTQNRARYWLAVVLTSTVGAVFGDFLTKDDGLNLGYGVGSAILIGIFAIILLMGRFTAGSRASGSPMPP